MRKKSWPFIWAVSLVVCFTSIARCGNNVSSRDLEKLIDAIAQIESNNRSKAVGDNGRAIGAYQIHRAYWKDGTRVLGVKWSYGDAFDPGKARRVVRAYLQHYGRGKTLIQMARIHNGGPRGYRKKATLGYGRKVLSILSRKRN
ncbi:MAG: transglycosylase SLT domain-containing protein [Planctomycetota bacterium]|jgi:soluble lytic murein transglycosylase-like protein